MSAAKYVVALLVVLGIAASAAAQEQPRGERGDRGIRGDRGGGEGGDRREEFRQRFSAQMKEMMGATDEEWQVLQPKIERLQQLQQASSAGRGAFMMFAGRGGGGFGGGGGGGGRDGGQSDANTSPVQQKATDLQASINNKEAKPEELKVKLAALREARQKAKADLTKAQEELRELLTIRQEAVLVVMGMLE
jgi:hypothetical protein